jgi:hypothetical protein
MSGLLTKAENAQRSMSYSECVREQGRNPIDREQALDSKLARQFNCPAQRVQVMVPRNFAEE